MPEALYLMRRSSRELPLKWLGCGCRKTHLVCIPRAPWVCQRHPYGAVYFHAPSDQEARRLRGPYAMNHNLVEQASASTSAPATSGGWSRSVRRPVRRCCAWR